jgi:nitrate reductase gamma subunit
MRKIQQTIRWVFRQIYKIPVYNSREDERLYGRFRVIYKDGKRSEPMSWDVANTYASIFDGEVKDAFYVFKAELYVSVTTILLGASLFILLLHLIGFLQAQSSAQTLIGVMKGVCVFFTSGMTTSLIGLTIMTLRTNKQERLNRS